MPGPAASTLIALTGGAVIAFAFLAFIANRRGRQVISALLAAVAWLFLAAGALIWLWQ